MGRTLAEWLDYQASVHPRVIELGLGRMNALMARLAVPRPGGPVFVVAGTNGKGSVAATLEALLTEQGLRVGTYTSPHLVRYNERIRIAGLPIGDQALCSAFERVEAERAGLPLTFFEYGTAAALVAFNDAPVDAWVLEVGLGGRLDAVNVVDGDASIVVSIGLDHTEWLGPDVESIGREKAGIFRPGRPAILGSRDLPRSVSDTARAIGAPTLTLGRDFDARAGEHDQGFVFEWHGEALATLPDPALPGRVQRDNAACALAALAALNRLPPTDVIVRALGRVRLAGRFQVERDRHDVEWILDVAHNPPAAVNLASNLAARPASGRTFALVGILADKDARAIGEALQGRFDGFVALDLEGDRGRSATDLAALLQGSLGTDLGSASDVERGMRALAEVATAGDRVVVFGSFHVVGPALEWLRLYLA